MKTELLVRMLIGEQVGKGPDEVVAGASLVDDLGVDSLDCIELLMHIEDEFGHEIEDDEAKRCILVGDVVKLVESKVGAEVERT